MIEVPETGDEVMDMCGEYTVLADELRGLPCAVNFKHRQRTAVRLFHVCAALGLALPQEFADECRAAVSSSLMGEPHAEHPVEWDMSAEKMREHYGLSRYDLDGTTKRLRTWLNNYAKRCGVATPEGDKFAYLFIPEFHKDGAIHFHGVFRGVNSDDLFTNRHGYLDFAPAFETFGFCSLGKIRDLQRCASYIGKYISKSMFAGLVTEVETEKRVKPSKHLYFASQKLKRDKVLVVGECAWKPEDFLEAGYNPVLDNEWLTKYEVPSEAAAKECMRGFSPIKADKPADFRVFTVEDSADLGVKKYLFPSQSPEKIRKRAVNRQLKVQSIENLPKRPENETLGGLWDRLFTVFTPSGKPSLSPFERAENDAVKAVWDMIVTGLAFKYGFSVPKTGGASVKRGFIADRYTLRKALNEYVKLLKEHREGYFDTLKKKHGEGWESRKWVYDVEYTWSKEDITEVFTLPADCASAEGRAHQRGIG